VHLGNHAEPQKGHLMLLYPSATLKYLRESGRRTTESSQRGMRSVLSLLQSFYPTTQVHAFTEDQLRRFCLATSRAEVPAPGTTLNRRTCVMSFYAWAHYTGMVPTNPAANLKFTVNPPNQGVRQHLWLNEQQVADVIRACPETLRGFRDKVVLSVGFMTGLRCHEITGLRWSNFSPDLVSVSVLGKGRKLMTIGLPPQLSATLLAWKQTAESDVVVPPLGTGFARETLVWSRSLGLQGIRTLTADAGRRAGFPELEPHDMRRSFAGILEAKGVAIQDISKLLRHANIGTTQRYLEKNPAKLVALGNGLEFNL
jgi:integrase/recombinase XerC